MPKPSLAELPTPHTDLEACRRTLCGGSRSFWVASQLLPSSLKNSACGLYAFCREADDAIDDGDNPAEALAMLHQRLDDIYAGSPQNSSTDRVMTRLVAEHRLPRALLDGLLEGFSWDATGRRYNNLSELYDYAARVAGAVGVMMAVLMGVRDRDALARAADLGVAMQLTNIARDVGEDARAGRVYLPTDMLEAANISVDQLLAEPTFSPALGGIVEQLLDRADVLYSRSEHGVPSLPGSCRLGIYAARRLYAGIGDHLRTLDYNSIDTRSVLDAKQKFSLIASTLNALNLPTDQLGAPALDECHFLINAVTQEQHPTVPTLQADPVATNFYQRLVWMLDLFAALEDRNSTSKQTH